MKLLHGEGRRMEFGQFVDWAFLLFLSGLGAYVANSINQLNERVAVVVEQIGSHEKRLDVLERNEFNRRLDARSK